MKDEIKKIISETFAPAINFNAPYAVAMLDAAARSIVEALERAPAKAETVATLVTTYGFAQGPGYLDAASVDDDWVLVPRQPTEAMVAAGGSALARYIAAMSDEERAKLKPRSKRPGDNAGYKISPWTKCRIRWAAMIEARPKFSATRDAQRASFVRGEMGMGSDRDEAEYRRRMAAGETLHDTPSGRPKT